MSVANAYSKVKRSIVAFTLKYIPLYGEDDQPPAIPPIIGTGFAVEKDGLIATNAHVVDAFTKVFRPPDAPEDEWSVNAMYFHLTDAGIVEIPLEVLGVMKIEKFGHGKHYYGPKEGPDLAFVKLKVRDLPVVTLETNRELHEGTEIATAGFPMGIDALTAPGWLHQLTPTLQTGIVSAVLPFSSPSPHAYSINVMTQGGASGSPVFLTDTGGVIGVLYAGLYDLDTTLKGKDPFRVPTAISYVVPSHYIKAVFDSVLQSLDVATPDSAQTIEQMLEGAELKNRFDHDREWIRKKIDSEAERARITKVRTVLPNDLPSDKKP